MQFSVSVTLAIHYWSVCDIYLYMYIYSVQNRCSFSYAGDVLALGAQVAVRYDHVAFITDLASLVVVILERHLLTDAL